MDGIDIQAFMPVIMWLFLIVMIVMMVRSMLESMGLMDLIQERKRYRQKERNILEKVHRDIKRGAKLSKPSQLRQLYFEGDEEHPAKYVGRIVGFSGHKDINHIVIKTSMLTTTKVILCHEDMHSDIFSRHLYVKARGMQPVATYFWTPIYTTGEKDLNKRWNEIRDHVEIQITKALGIWVPEEMAKQVITGMRPSEKPKELFTRTEIPAYEEVKGPDGRVVE